MASIIFLILFFINIAMHLAIIPTKDEQKLKKLTLLTKPFLMPLLILYYTINNPNINNLIVVSLALGWVGDVTLIFPKNEKCFLIGLGSFLTGHLLYIIAFIRVVDFDNLSNLVFLSIIPFVIFFVVVWRYLNDDLGEMKIPVAFYMFLIITMSFFSICVWQSPIIQTLGDETLGNNWLPFVGSVLFIASDTMLANQLFKKPFKYDQIHIMWTYLFAQFCIAQAFIVM